MAAGWDPGSIRASDGDRSRAQTLLNDAYADGRLTQEEWEERATALGGPVTHADLARLTADLPSPYVVPVPMPSPAAYQVQTAQPPTNGMAIASLVCGLGQVVGGPFAGIAAIILGHQARRQIRLTGQQGDGMAVTGLVLGYVGTGLAVLALVALLLIGVAVVHGGGGAPVVNPAPG
jgi:Domain of unknown function (DUF4190)/DUF1707 SHOCT-like domain